MKSQQLKRLRVGSTKSKTRALAVVCFCSMMIHETTTANEPESEVLSTDAGSSWTLVLENDIFVGEDNGYTNGLGILFAHGTYENFTEENTPRLLYKLIGKSYINTTPNRRRGVIYAFGQTMQTPENITATTLQVDDVPYAGLLAAEAQFYSVSNRLSDKLSLTIGLVGPTSLAEPSQDLVHGATGSEIPNGWGNQLKNELVGKMELQRGYRAFHTTSERHVEFDLVTIGNAAIGNLTSFVSASVIARVGDNITGSFPVISLLPNRQVNTMVFEGKFSWYAFAGVQSAYVANDIFANGNTFTDSHSVDLDNTQTRVSGGLSFGMGDWAFTFVYSKLNDVPSADPFGSFSISHRY